MNRSATLTVITAGIISAIALPQSGHAQASHTGTVKRVWEDGFRLHTGEQTLWVNTSNLSGENTLANITVGDQLKVTGEFQRIEFDAASITVATLSR